MNHNAGNNQIYVSLTRMGLDRDSERHRRWWNHSAKVRIRGQKSKKKKTVSWKPKKEQGYIRECLTEEGQVRSAWKMHIRYGSLVNYPGPVYVDGLLAFQFRLFCPKNVFLGALVPWQFLAPFICHCTSQLF